MLLPGFNADAALTLQRQRLPLGARDSSLAPVGLSGCIDVDHMPVCYSRNPFTPGRCCDSTVEKICNGHRVAICTFTDCTGFPDTASL